MNNPRFPTLSNDNWCNSQFFHAHASPAIFLFRLACPTIEADSFG
jgi:hypothetical protein